MARSRMTPSSSLLPNAVKDAYPNLLKNWRASRGSWKQVNFDPMWSSIDYVVNKVSSTICVSCMKMGLLVAIRSTIASLTSFWRLEL